MFAKQFKEGEANELNLTYDLYKSDLEVEEEGGVVHCIAFLSCFTSQKEFFKMVIFHIEPR